MECLSERFKECLIEWLNSEKRVIATIAFKGSGIIEEIKKRKDVKLFEITQRNRESLLPEILGQVEEYA
jgi:nucleoside-triphosphatase